MALEDGVEIYRDSLKSHGKPDFFLAEGDSLRFLKKTGLILVTGEVNSPGYVSYKNISVKKYLKAGGFTSFAEKRISMLFIQMELQFLFQPGSQPIVKEGSNNS